jgi:hypothetical protein
MPNDIDTHGRLLVIPKLNYWRLGALFFIFVIAAFISTRVLIISGVFYKTPIIVYVIGGLMASTLCWMLSIYFHDSSGGSL